VIAGVFVAVELAVSARYGFQQDEVYFLVAGHRLAFGYVDQPPLIPLLTRITGGAVVLKDVGIADVNEMLAPPRAAGPGTRGSPAACVRFCGTATSANAIALLPRGLFACSNTAASQDCRHGIL
jgi:hypothetical protein